MHITPGKGIVGVVVPHTHAHTYGVNQKVDRTSASCSGMAGCMLTSMSRLQWATLPGWCGHGYGIGYGHDDASGQSSGRLRHSSRKRFVGWIDFVNGEKRSLGGLSLQFKHFW